MVELAHRDFPGWTELFDSIEGLNLGIAPEEVYENNYKIGISDTSLSNSIIEQLLIFPGVVDVYPSFLIDDTMPIDLGTKIRVLFKPGMQPGVVDSIAKAFGLEISYHSQKRPLLFYYTLPGKGHLELLNIANQLYESQSAILSMIDFYAPQVSYAVPSDSYYVNQYYLHQTTVDFENAYDYTISVDTILIALLDTGLEPHDDLPASRIQGGCDYTYPDIIPRPYSLPDICTIGDQHPSASWHGIAVSSLISAIGDNGIYMSGSARNTKILMQKIFDCNRTASVGNDTRAILDAVDSGAVIISNSWSFTTCTAFDLFLSYAIYYADSCGVLVVFSAGNCTDLWNCGECVPFPANHQFALTVAATDRGNDRWAYSAYDMDSFIVDLAAPGEHMLTLDQMGTGIGYRKIFHDIPCGSDYNIICYVDGTSFASPLVAGLAALLMGRRPDLRLKSNDLKYILKLSTGGGWHEPPIEDNHDSSTALGYGRINAARAMVAVSHGNVNNDLPINIIDCTYTIAYIYKNGPAPIPNYRLADANCDGSINVADVTFLISYLHMGGPPPPHCFKF